MLAPNVQQAIWSIQQEVIVWLNQSATAFINRQQLASHATTATI